VISKAGGYADQSDRSQDTARILNYLTNIGTMTACPKRQKPQGNKQGKRKPPNHLPIKLLKFHTTGLAALYGKESEHS
jgi:hypothetical protein